MSFAVPEFAFQESLTCIVNNSQLSFLPLLQNTAYGEVIGISAKYIASPIDWLGQYQGIHYGFLQGQKGSILVRPQGRHTFFFVKSCKGWAISAKECICLQ